jgi:hypothetical protein
MRKKKQKPELEQWQLPLSGRDLGWTDEFGRRWDKPTDIFFKEWYADPTPPNMSKRNYRKNDNTDVNQ